MGLGRRGLAARRRTPQGRAQGSSGFRREERSGAMVSHRDRRTTKSVTRTPRRPTGYGGIGPFATLPLLDRWGTSTSSRRLAYVPMALVTRSRRVLPRTAMGYGGIGPSATLPLLDRWGDIDFVVAPRIRPNGARNAIPAGFCRGLLGSETGGDAHSSRTSSDNEIAANPHRPEGFPRIGTVFVVVPPLAMRDIRSMHGIRRIVAPRIRPRCAPNVKLAIYGTGHQFQRTRTQPRCRFQ